MPIKSILAEKKPTILIADDVAPYRWFLTKQLEADYQIIEASTGKECLAKMSKRPDIVLLDVNLPPDDLLAPQEIGIKLVPRLLDVYPRAAIIIVTAFTSDDVEKVVEAVRNGACDYLLKGNLEDNSERLKTSIRNALERNRLVSENISLKGQVDRKVTFDDIIGESAAIQNLKEEARFWAQSEVDVLLIGETGVGKDLLATAMHNHSKRKHKPFKNLNCGGISANDSNTAHTRLFGVVADFISKGHPAFQGVFPENDGGTILLNEIGKTPALVQPILLDVLESKEFTPLGGNRCQKLDLRFFYATDVDLDNAIAQDTFLRSLKGRMAKWGKIRIPPLRKRPEDIILLCQHFFPIINAQCHSNVQNISTDALKHLMAYEWPENIRELSGVLGTAVQRATAMRSTTIHLEHLPEELQLKNSRTPEHGEPAKQPRQAAPSPDYIIPTERNKADFTTPELSGNEPARSNWHTFIRTFFECEGNLAKVSKHIGKSDDTVSKYLEKSRDEILEKLCRADGNLDLFAKEWAVSSEKVKQGLAKKSRFLRHIEVLLSIRNHKMSEAALLLRVSERQFSVVRSLLKAID